MVETISQLLLVALVIATTPAATSTDMPPQVWLKVDGNSVFSHQQISSFCLNHHAPTLFF